jgi:hypothetical protein
MGYVWAILAIRWSYTSKKPPCDVEENYGAPPNPIPNTRYREGRTRKRTISTNLDGETHSIESQGGL